MINIFLSASVPLPGRNKAFIETADVVAIREAIKALVFEVIPRGHLIFGGHPAITPLIALLIRGLGKEAKGRIVLYQSAYYREHFIDENKEFIDLRVVPAVGNSAQQSVALMRQRMIDDINFDAAVFIGGMEGVIEEFAKFRSRHKEAPAWPIASTGAAALKIFEADAKSRPELLHEITYSTLFRKLLSEVG